MAQPQRFLQLPLIGGLLLLLLTLYLFASKRFEGPKPEEAVAKKKVETSPQDALKYWSADKKRNAKPVKLPSTDKLEERKKPKAE